MISGQYEVNILMTVMMLYVDNHLIWLAMKSVSVTV